MPKTLVVGLVAALALSVTACAGSTTHSAPNQPDHVHVVRSLQPVDDATLSVSTVFEGVNLIKHAYPADAPAAHRILASKPYRHVLPAGYKLANYQVVGNVMRFCVVAPNGTWGTYDSRTGGHGDALGYADQPACHYRHHG